MADSTQRSTEGDVIVDDADDDTVTDDDLIPTIVHEEVLQAHTTPDEDAAAAKYGMVAVPAEDA